MDVPVCYKGRPIGVHLREDLKDHVKNRDQPKVADVHSTRHFGGEGNDPVV